MNASKTHAPDWVETDRRPGRDGEDDQIWRTFQAPVPSTDGYRVIWVHSTGKTARDGAARIEGGIRRVAVHAAQSFAARVATRVGSRHVLGGQYSLLRHLKSTFWTSGKWN